MHDLLLLIFESLVQISNSVYNGCHNLLMPFLKISNIAIIIFKNVNYYCIIYILTNLKQLIYQKILCLKMVAIYKKWHVQENGDSATTILTIQSKQKNQRLTFNLEKNYQDLVVYFTGYVVSMSMKTHSLHYHELIEKMKENKGKNI